MSGVLAGSHGTADVLAVGSTAATARVVSRIRERKVEADEFGDWRRVVTKEFRRLQPFMITNEADAAPPTLPAWQHSDAPPRLAITDRKYADAGYSLVARRESWKCTHCNRLADAVVGNHLYECCSGRRLTLLPKVGRARVEARIERYIHGARNSRKYCSRTRPSCAATRQLHSHRHR